MSKRIDAPAQIEARSMQIIDEELRARNVVRPQGELVVLRRVIHATADFDYVDNLVCTGGAIDAGIRALSHGVPVVTDTNMARSGISKAALGRLGTEVHCFVGDADVAQMARESGQTRAVMAMRKALTHVPDALVAVGNAPTALFELCDRMRDGVRPSLVIAVPVGFVNVVEAKEQALACCREWGIPAIVARGRKGGSTVATAIVNALAYEAANLTDPHARM